MYIMFAAYIVSTDVQYCYDTTLFFFKIVFDLLDPWYFCIFLESACQVCTSAMVIHADTHTYK